MLLYRPLWHVVATNRRVKTPVAYRKLKNKLKKLNDSPGPMKTQNDAGGDGESNVSHRQDGRLDHKLEMPNIHMR